MWQRIQTLYIIISTALTAVLFFSDRAGDMAYTSYLPYLILAIIIAALDVIALCAFRFRIFQFRTVVLSAIFSIALQAWLAVEFFVSGNDPAFHITAVFPAVSTILDVLAAAGIWTDELMVRSASRLRGSRRRR